MTPYLLDPDFTLYQGDVRDVLKTLPDESVHCVVTSPPYWGLRDYGAEGQLGLEATPDLYLANMVAVFREVRRVLRSDGTCWLNIGDSYAGGGGGNYGSGLNVAVHRSNPTAGKDKPATPDGLKPKDLCMIPARLALALQADGWWLRSQIVWSKPNPMPESVTDRPTTSHEFVYLLAKSPRYFFDQEAVRETGEGRLDRGRNGSKGRIGEQGWTGEPLEEANGRNIRSVWEIATQPYPEAHFATYPEELVRRCILAGCPEGGTVLDPFMGSGTTALVARKHGRRTIGVELSAEYCALAARRLSQLSLLAEAT